MAVKFNKEIARSSVASILDPVPARRFEPGETDSVKEGRAPESRGETRASTKERVRTPIYQTAGRGREGRWKKSRNYVTSFVFDVDQYERVRKVSYTHRLSLKEATFRLIQLGLEELKRNRKAIQDADGDDGEPEEI